MSEEMMSGRGKGACPEEFEGSENVVKAASVARRTPSRHATGWLTAFAGDITMALVKYGTFLASGP